MFQITCITKDDRFNPYERITHVGGVSGDKSFYVTQEEVIEAIKRGLRFFVKVNGESVAVVTAISRFGNRYIKTENDGDKPNNLLSLTGCRI